MQKRQVRPHQTKKTSRKNELALLAYELRLLREENGRVCALLQEAFKVGRPTENHLGSLDRYSIPKHFAFNQEQEHYTDCLRGLALNMERYNYIRSALLHASTSEPLEMRRDNDVYYLSWEEDFEYTSPLKLLDAWIETAIEGALLKNSFRPQSASLPSFSSYKHLVELSSSSNTGEGENSEPTTIGFVFDYYIAVCYQDTLNVSRVPVDPTLIIGIVRLLLRPSRLEPEPPDTETWAALSDVIYTNNDRNAVHFPVIFLRGYFQRWESLSKNADVRQMNPEILWCAYRIRCFISLRLRETIREAWGIVPEREGGSFFGHDNTWAEFEVAERRFCLYLVCPRGASSRTQYLLLRVVDAGNEKPNLGDENDAWQKLELRNCLRWAGIVAFQFSICRILREWQDDWRDLLDRIDKVVRVKSTDILKRESRRGLMYDDEQLSQSEIYFSILQLLRVFDETITRGERDLQSLADSCCNHIEMVAQNSHKGVVEEEEEEAAALKIIAENWKIIVSSHKTSAGELLERINRKTEDIKSLHDGLFNAQSVRETTKAARMNHYLLIFTVVTILYLPPTFAATFFGMHLFDGENGPGEWTQKTFWKVFGGVTGVTYLVSAVALMGVRKRRTVTSWLLGLPSQAWHTPRVLLRRINKGLKLLELAMAELVLDRSVRSEAGLTL